MNEFWSALVQNLLMAFAPVLASLLAAFLFAQFKLVWAKFKAQQPDYADTLEWVARTAVTAAEQAGAGKIGAEKKAYAIKVARMWLESKGLVVDLDMVSAAIEAAVWQEINSGKESKPATDRSPIPTTSVSFSQDFIDFLNSAPKADDDPTGGLTDPGEKANE